MILLFYIRTAPIVGMHTCQHKSPQESNNFVDRSMTTVTYILVLLCGHSLSSLLNTDQGR